MRKVAEGDPGDRPFLFWGRISPHPQSLSHSMEEGGAQRRVREFKERVGHFVLWVYSRSIFGWRDKVSDAEGGVRANDARSATRRASFGHFEGC